MSHYVFIDDALEINEAYEIDNEEHRHLTKVLRAKEGDFVQLINGRGTLAKGRLISVEKAKSHVLIESIIENETTNGTSRRKSILAQAFPKLNKLDFIVEKGTELGIDTFYLFTGEKSEKKSLSESGLKRLKKIAISAMKQSKRLFLPKIEVFNSAHEIPVNNTNVYFGDIDSTTPFLTLLDTSNNASTELGSVTSNLFFIGPEKGWSKKEINFLKKIGKGVLLSDAVLRTETAAITAAVLLNHKNISD